MRYSGSKARYVKDIVPIITKNLTTEKIYIEPFLGGGSIFSAIDHKNKIGSDINSKIIEMWKAFQSGLKPPSHVSEEEYYTMKEVALKGLKTYPEWILGYVSVACSYGSAPWNGYAKFNAKRNEDHIKEAYNGTIKQINDFKHFNDSKFICRSYDEIPMVHNAIIYNDIPYEGTKGYKTGDFDFEKFWNWARMMHENGNEVFVSSYNAPSDFKCVWRKKKHDGMGTTIEGKKQKIKIEKLYKL